MPVLVMRDHASRLSFSEVFPVKGTKHAYCVKQVCANIETLGHSKFILRSDQEPAILDLCSSVIQDCKSKGIDVLKEHSPVGESQSNGVVERAIQDVEGLVRTLKDDLESRYIQRYHNLLLLM